MTFAEQLKAERERLGINQTVCAQITDTSFSWVEKAERNERVPHIAMQEGVLSRLADVLVVDGWPDDQT